MAVNQNPEEQCGVQTDCCPNPIPPTLTATLHNVADCGGLDGATATLTYDPLTKKWEGAVTVCSETFRFQVYCNDQSEDWAVDLTSNCVLDGFDSSTWTPGVSMTCDPFNITQPSFGDNTEICGCCNAPDHEFGYTITE